LAKGGHDQREAQAYTGVWGGDPGGVQGLSPGQGVQGGLLIGGVCKFLMDVAMRSRAIIDTISFFCWKMTNNSLFDIGLKSLVKNFLRLDKGVSHHALLKYVTGSLFYEFKRGCFLHMETQQKKKQQSRARLL